jgi:peptidoglycan lytic transglycosylase G
VIARIAAYALAAVVLVGVTLGAVADSLLRPLADQGAEVLFEVKRGESLRAIATRLEQHRIVRDARATTWWARLLGKAEQLHAGQYWLSPALSSAEIIDRIAAGRVATWEVVIPEGLTAAEIGERLAARGIVDETAFTAAAADPSLARELDIPAASLEGYLFPETYRLPRGRTGPEVVRVLVAQFRAAWDQVEARAAERGLSMHQVVTLASIVEKETGVPSERPMIASVFANRLRLNMRLESDPTVIYGIAGFDGNLHRSDLENAGNAYNTYQHAGLPPGPISNPGLDALRAVVDPAQSKLLYFVSRNDGTHEFSETYAQHVAAVDRYQRRRTAH